VGTARIVLNGLLDISGAFGSAIAKRQVAHISDKTTLRYPQKHSLLSAMNVGR